MAGMRYDIATLALRLGTYGRAIPAVDAWSKAAEAKGRLLGAWLSETGDVNEFTLLRAYADDAEMQEERWRTLETTNPFGCGDIIVNMRFDSYAPFPWVRPVQPGRYGNIYEIRTYWLKHGGVPATIASWHAAMPKRSLFSPMIVAMYALDGAPRFTHVWPYRSMQERAEVRADTVAKGIWPPSGGPDWLTGEITRVIAVPTGISPLA